MGVAGSAIILINITASANSKYFLSMAITDREGHSSLWKSQYVTKSHRHILFKKQQEKTVFHSMGPLMLLGL